MDFPKDHKPHSGIEIEWWYVWGITNKGWLHWALFKKGDELAIHDSLHTQNKSNYYEAVPSVVEDVLTINEDIHIHSPSFDCDCFIEDFPVIHTHERSYYSIPHILIEGYLFGDGGQERILGEGWFDHEWGDKPKENWEWIGMHFDRNSGMVYQEKNKKLPYDIRSLTPEKIFYPQFGWPYSEQPVYVFDDKKLIGRGMRERTYRS